jgi:hypothetical protein
VVYLHFFPYYGVAGDSLYGVGFLAKYEAVYIASPPQSAEVALGYDVSFLFLFLACH